MFFRDPRQASREGLVGRTPRITTGLLLEAYAHGVFPWSDRPARWFSPDPRAVFDLDRVHLSRRLLRVLRQGRFEVTFDQAFAGVLLSCARHHHDSWISTSMIEAYTEFHQLGYAHSVEVWHDDYLVGGLYGVQLGAMFAGESMFHFQAEASKVAFAHLVLKLRQLGVVLFDSQVLSPLTASLGAYEIPRAEFLDRLESALRVGLPQQSWND